MTMKPEQFKREYNSVWGVDMGKHYDTPINEGQKELVKYHQYELLGLGKDDIKVETEFENKTQRTYINITGKMEHDLTGWENDINVHLFIDTSIYKTYSWDIQNGLLTICLHEKVNPKPEFNEVKYN